eukprot:TRINITY_DN16594_c0_g1_i1.p1 TRINITY_DN16594_c0_g1~~TRINITY_DN16594_c0_g1_i1.p1  ORF type:complete len:122 (+),score=21.16 TRINITY_DN16594_c0_g1_i1:117-482(+)
MEDEVGLLRQGLSQAREQAGQVERKTRNLREQFQQAQLGAQELGQLCDNAEAIVKRSQSQLNRAARELHVLNERTNHLLGSGPVSELGLGPLADRESSPKATTRSNASRTSRAPSSVASGS